MATLLELCKIKHHAVRSDGAKFIDGERNDSLPTPWLTVNSTGRVTLGPGLYDELLVVKGHVSDEQIKTWAAMGAPFFDPSPVIPDEQIPSGSRWDKGAQDASKALDDAKDARDAADDAKDTANQKNRTYYQATAPTGAHTIGDIWFDTSDHHKRHWWDGSIWQDADQESFYAEGSHGVIEFNKHGYKAIRKPDGKIMQHFDIETGSNYWEGDGVFKGRIEADEGYFHGDITGATGEFHGSLKAKSIKAGWYEEIRNVLPYTGQDSLDSSKPIVIPFYIPAETTNIVAAFLSAEARRYRAYSRSAPYDVNFWLNKRTGVVATFATDPVTVTYNEDSNAQTGYTAVDHVHRYSTGGIGDYDHTGRARPSAFGQETNLSHRHTYSRISNIKLNNFNTHVHEFDPSHDHPLDFGIHEDTTPSNVRIRINNGSGWSSYISLASAPSGDATYDLIAGASVPKHNSHASEMDLTPYLSGAGWKHIEFSSSRLGLIAWNIILKLDITA